MHLLLLNVAALITSFRFIPNLTSIVFVNATET